jgi:hypothetical protein
MLLCSIVVSTPRHCHLLRPLEVHETLALDVIKKSAPGGREPADEPIVEGDRLEEGGV